MLIEASTPLYQDRRLEELPQELLARVADIGATASYGAHQSTTPEHPGVVSLETLGIPGAAREKISSPAFSVTGDYMPSIDIAKQDLEQLYDSELIGELMKQTRISKLTGCIMRPEVYRTHKGYSKTAVKAVRELGLGNSGREAHRVVHFAREAERIGQLPSPSDLKKQVDHLCRNPACLYHTRLLASDDNNSLRAEAQEIEPDIINGQSLYITDLLDKLPWLAHSLSEEGEKPAKVISTRAGPFALRLANPTEFVVYGERVPCEVYDSLKAPGKKPANRKSRAKPKIPNPIPDHLGFFAKTKYRKKHLADQKEQYQAAVKQAA